MSKYDEFEGVRKHLEDYCEFRMFPEVKKRMSMRCIIMSMVKAFLICYCILSTYDPACTGIEGEIWRLKWTIIPF
jgi:hypothetical protein